MASAKKASSRRKSGPAQSEAVGLHPATASVPGSNKNIVRALIGMVLIVCVYEGIGIFRSSEKPKDFKVQLISSFSGDGKACGPFSAWGIASIGKDKVALADTNNSRILVFDRQGKFINGWGKPGKGPMKFHEPSGMTSDDKGNAYVMDAWNGAIKGFEVNGKETLDLELGDNSGFYGPRGIAFDGKNFVVADTGSHRVVLVSPTGGVVASWGKNGKGKGEFNGPLDAATDGKGDYFVADSGNNRMQWLNADGKTVKVFKYDGGVPAVAVDREGRVYVSVGEGDGAVKAYDSKGEYLGDLKDQNGSSQSLAGARYLNVTPDDVLLVSLGTKVALVQLPTVNP